MLKDLIKKINVQEVCVIGVCGLALVLSIVNAMDELAMAIGGGLVGYLGSSATTKP